MPQSDPPGPEEPQAEERAAGFHRALGDRRRAWIVHELKAARGGLAVEDFAGRLRLHPNTVRWHLRVLEEAGLVLAQGEGRSTAGRPRLVYKLTAAGVVAEAADEQLLALILAGIVAQSADGPVIAEQAGFEWGRHLAHSPVPLAPLTTHEALAEIAFVLDRLGFASEPTESRIRLRRSTLERLIVRYPEVVATPLRGVVSGVLAETSGELHLSALSLPSAEAGGVVELQAGSPPEAAES